MVVQQKRSTIIASSNNNSKEEKGDDWNQYPKDNSNIVLGNSEDTGHFLLFILVEGNTSKITI